MTRTGKQEAAAWRKLAEEVDASPNRTKLFLCLCINGEEERWWPDSKVSAPVPELRGRMSDRIKGHDFGRSAYIPEAWTTIDSGEHNNVRVLACLWMAHEAEEEG